MNHTDAIIIGAGQAGLALSRALSMRGIAHAVLERGRTGERWRSERWDSLRLLSIARQSYLPGLPHEGVDPEYFLPSQQFADYLGRYAQIFAAPVIGMSAVEAVREAPEGFEVRTTSQCWLTRAVIIATGACDVAYRPPIAAFLPAKITQIVPKDYRSPEHLPQGGVLVVGASSTGLQIAEELQASGRPVTLSVGEHTRMVRRYRGRDIYDWLGDSGVLDDRAEHISNLEAARRQPSTQLIGSPDHRELNLATVAAQGIRLVGRLTAIDGSRATFVCDLSETTARSHRRLIKTLQRIDAYIDQNRLTAPPSEIDCIRQIAATSNDEVLDLSREGITSVVWATGYKRDYSWLKLPAIDEQGEIIHQGGATKLPGLFVLGLTFLRRRRSAFIDGCGVDAEDVADLVKSYLDHQARRLRIPTKCPAGATAFAATRDAQGPCPLGS